MKMIIDAFGGDNAPAAMLKAGRRAADELGVEIAFTGDEDAIVAAAKELNVSLDGLQILPASQILPVSEDPTRLLKEYSDSSMAVGFKALADGTGDAFISSGSTGGLTVGATLLVKRIKGVRRPAIGTVVPNAKKGYLLIDAGANDEVRPEMLQQFAVMGSVYMERFFGVKNPRVGLLNIGTEENKGTQVYRDAYQLLKNAPVNFIGNVEGRAPALGEVDVVVCDGFAGNIALKVTEGMGKMVSNALRDVFYTNLLTKLAYVMVSKPFKAFKAKFDTKSIGGAPFLGVRKPVIKAHGNSDEVAFFNAIRQAKICCETKVIEGIEEGLAELSAQAGGAQE